jgi:hypothetical protein
MTTRIERVVARVLVRSVYKCVKCSAERAGTGREIPFDVHAPEEIRRFVDGIVTPPHGMPVGWGHYGNGQYRCDACAG